MKLAIIATHPIQYYAPWFRAIAAQPSIELKVFYLWDFGITEKFDPGFGCSFQWDIPLLEGYDYEFVENVSEEPGTHHYGGLHNPDLTDRVETFAPDCVLLMAYKYKSTIDFVSYWKIRKRSPVLFRGDSHRLKERTGLRERFKKFGLSIFYRYFIDACLYVGEANRDYFLQHTVPEKRLFFTPHAIDNQRFMAEIPNEEVMEWRNNIGIPADHTVVLFLGKFEEKKRPLDLLNAFLSLQPESTSLLFVGDGLLSKDLLQAATAHANVFTAPFQNQSDIPRTLAACDLIVLPSDEGETWGLVINEAMCVSKPAIVSDLVGCGSDLVVPYKTGLSFKCADVKALTDALEEALSDRERLKQWGDAAREHIQQYSYDQATEGLLAAIRSCDNFSH